MLLRSAARSKPPRHQQHNDDDDHQSHACTGPVSPAPAVRPSRDRTNQQHDQNNQKYESQTQGPSPRRDKSSTSLVGTGDGSAPITAVLPCKQHRRIQCTVLCAGERCRQRRLNADPAAKSSLACMPDYGPEPTLSGGHKAVGMCGLHDRWWIAI